MVTILAAKMGPRQVARMLTAERMKRIVSRLASGQFYPLVSRLGIVDAGDITYQGIIEVIRGLWYQHHRFCVVGGALP